MNNKRVLMIAAENDFLPGAKVGGVADVLRDLPPELVAQGMTVDVVLPSYGFLARLPGMEVCAEVDVPFWHTIHKVQLLKYTQPDGGVTNYIIDHPLFSQWGESVYCNDDGDRPFATDATKFAFFSMALSRFLVKGLLPVPDVLHCHDWHTAFLLILIKFDPTLIALKKIKSVFTIHNLAMQGVRPFGNDDSSFEAWFPFLTYDGVALADPVSPNCINPLRAAIQFADIIHTVSPTYAEEILQPSQPELGIYGGEGLEKDLLERHQHGDLLGIINGCDYPKGERVAAPAKKKVVSLAQQSLVSWSSKSPLLKSAHFIADKRLQTWSIKKTRGFVVTYVGRITEQKVKLLKTRVGSKTALELILDKLGAKNQFVLLGSGDSQYEEFLTRVSGEYENFIFLNGFSQELSNNIYRYGDLFLMPSSFEPCGISQMLAMRAGQPCLVNAVGGLKDTIIHEKTGYSFSGNSSQEQARAMVDEFSRLLDLHDNSPENWKKVAEAARAERFTWENSATDYIGLLYRE